ncbi:helix-turn-helix domain-containing protein [Fructobacillus ficulneus]|uniref:Transcriptional regulator n=1 Tax=Fructobacillus ficulneus TaxID=157463 RepID=A0A0K8MKC6_9LACO|nr:helix-turn-helix transcriptional regulator [Fructobacillus ficulneus]GAP00345.1 transcriptional regulator [Fructobacillus ficulneus]
MTEIGEVFRLFRKGKNVTLQEASRGIVSYTFLSKFERGLTDISFMHLLELLDRINVQLSEFEFLYQKSNNYTNDLLPTLQRAYQSSDINSLKDHLRLWQNRSDKFSTLQRSNQIAFLLEDNPQFLVNEKKYLLKFLSENEIQEVFDFGTLELNYLNIFD